MTSAHCDFILGLEKYSLLLAIFCATFSFSVILCYLFCDTSPSQHKIIVAYQSSDYRLVIEIGQWATIKPNPRDNRLCHFALAMYLKMRHILCWNALFATLLERFFSSLFQKIALCSLKSFNELDRVTRRNLVHFNRPCD